jgi:molybdenum cofactor biosynthesis enzyme MoaA
MDKERLKLIVRNLKQLVDALESEVHSDLDAYKYDTYTQLTPRVNDYDEVFDDDDGYTD